MSPGTCFFLSSLYLLVFAKIIKTHIKKADVGAKH